VHTGQGALGALKGGVEGNRGCGVSLGLLSQQERLVSLVVGTVPRYGAKVQHETGGAPKLMQTNMTNMSCKILILLLYPLKPGSWADLSHFDEVQYLL
jgi:hypothetical protein